METFNIAIIKPNEISIDDFDLNTTPNDLMFLKDHIEILNVESNDFLVERIAESIGLVQGIICDSVIVKEGCSDVFQMFSLPENCFKILNKDETKKQNSIASLLNRNWEVVFDYAVVVMFGIKDNGTAKNLSITADDVINLLHQKIFKRAIKVFVDGSTQIITFKHDPRESIEKEMGVLEVDVYGFYFNVIHNKSSNDGLNKNIARLIGMGKLNGDCIVSLKTTENEYIDFNPDDYKVLMVICSNVVAEPEPEKTVGKTPFDIEYEETDKIDGIPVIKNRYISLKKRFEEFKDVCRGCNKEFKGNSMVCAGCYRTKYCSRNCQKKQWIFHKKECFGGKSAKCEGA